MKEQNRKVGLLRFSLALAGLSLMLGVGACGGDDSAPAPDGGAACGGIAGHRCPEDPSTIYCDFEDTVQCGATDGSGVCRARPTTCLLDCPGVCGCDGKFYCNACEAHRAGVDDAPGTTCMMSR